MSNAEKTKKMMGTAALLLTAVILAAGLFFLCYRLDNKYTAEGPQAIGGILMLSEQDLERYPVVYLVRDWEIYRGKLLAPEDFTQNAPLPDELTFIGQYGGFEGHMEAAGQVRSPHGSATYRLNISLPPEMKSYSLELPEIYCAYKLYINGALMAQMGDPDPGSYRLETGNSLVTVQAAGCMEILIAVSDYNHIYSGMVYPPAFGEPQSLTRLLHIRYGLRAAGGAISLCIGLLYLLVGILTRTGKARPRENALPLLYCALCVCFVLYTCYPVVKTLLTGGLFLYAVENLAWCTMLLLVLLIQNRILGMESKDEQGRRPLPFAFAFGVFACLWALLVPRFAGDNLKLMMAYSRVIGLYAWGCALYLTASAAWGVYKGIVYSKAMLAGTAVFGTALFMDRLLPLFEPIRFGWFAEISGGVLVALIGGVMAAEVAGQFRLRIALEGRVESVSRMMEMQSAYYPIVLEKEEDARAARHDLRHHIAMIRELVLGGEVEKLALYLDRYDDKQAPPVEASYCNHYVTDMLLRMYAGLARQQSIRLTVEAHLPEKLSIDDVDLCVILSNLLENALEASARIPQEHRMLRVQIRCALGRLGIFVENSFDGALQVENGRILSGKQKNRQGVGLASIRATVRRYGGGADFYSDENRVFHSEVMIPMRQDSPAGVEQEQGEGGA